MIFSLPICNCQSTRPDIRLLTVNRSAICVQGSCGIGPTDRGLTTTWPCNLSLGPSRVPLESQWFSDLHHRPSRIRTWAQDILKTVNKISESQLDIIQLTKYVQTWNLTKTYVFIMCSIHPTTDPGIVFSPKPNKKTHLRTVTQKLSSQTKNKNWFKKSQQGP